MSIRTKPSLYPIFLVHEQGGARTPETSTAFTVGHTLVPAAQKSRLTMSMTGQRIVIELTCEKFRELGDEVVHFLFDPAHNGRKPHNFIRIRCDGAYFYYDRFGYEYESQPLPVGFYGNADVQQGTLHLRMELPLADIGFRDDWATSAGRRWIGFNVYRQTSGKGDSGISKWSGQPCDSIVHGQGMGLLLPTSGLDENEIEEVVRLAEADRRGMPTRWEKRTVPSEIHTYVTRKKQGMTGRLRRSDVERARLNSETTAWGRAMRDSIVSVADYWAGKSDDELFDLVPAGNPRALTVAQYYGDPLYGGNFRTLQTCLERPYEFYNPATSTWWKLGMTIPNPTTGEPVVLDDPGDGFIAPVGFPNPHVRYMFKGAYRLFLLGMLMGSPYELTIEDPEVCPESSGKRYAGAINNLAYAFVLTGERRYAHKALLLIGRIAELIPYMNGNFADGTLSDTVHIAEPSTTESQWYDNFFEALDLLYDEIDDCAPELAALFARKKDAEGNPRTAPFCVKETVHELIPYLLYSAEMEVRRTADWSLRYIYKQLVLASFMQSGKLMRRILSEGPHSLQGKLRNLFYRDGRYAYDSMGYLDHICSQMIIMANNNYTFSDDDYYPEGINMFEDTQYGFFDIISFMFRVKSGSLIPAFGDWQLDNKEPLRPHRRQGLPHYMPSFEITFARMESARPLIGPLLSLYSEEELAAGRLQIVGETHLNHALLLLATASDASVYAEYSEAAKSTFTPFLLQNSETSVLRHGRTSADCKHVMLYGQPTAGHAHGDKLGLWIGAYGYHLLAGVGAYPFTWISPKISAWETHSAPCMVTLIDGRTQASSYSKQLAHYEGRHFQLAGLQNDIMYPGSHAERWAWLVPAPDSADAYVVDVTYVRGGTTFDYNTAGMLAPDRVSFHGIEEDDWEPLTGTLRGTLPGTEDAPLYEQPGYGWMKAQRRARVTGPVSWTYRYDHAALKVHTVPDRTGNERQVVFSLGEMGFQHMGRADWLPFVMWRDQLESTGADEAERATAADSHASTFCTVLEPYAQEPFLQSVQPLTWVSGTVHGSFQPIGVEITHATGHRDILVGTHAPGETVVFRDSRGRTITTDAKAALLRYAGEELLVAEVTAFTILEASGVSERRAASELRGRVVRVHENARRGSIDIVLDRDTLEAYPLLMDGRSLEGAVALFDADEYAKPSAYYMVNPQVNGDMLTFDTNITLICLNADTPFETKKRELGTKAHEFIDGVEVLLDLKPGDLFRVSNRFCYAK
ncbi:hypothetical protein [Paenibacillus sp. HJGM_3]|uniref:hypothetical protein n=1 Tax=Paenibacillus sp. HJGM_3 TaxID=3379816 RepID=UPI00385B29A8